MQVQDDKTIGLRILEYAVEYARETKQISDNGGLIELRLPAGCVIYWESTEHTPAEITVRLRTTDEPERCFDYTVRVFKMAEQNLESLEARQLLVLLPFCLVKFRKELKRKRMSPERRRALAAEAETLITGMEAILLRAQTSGVLTGEDALILMEHVIQMHDELYGDYPEFKEEQMVLEERFRSQFKIEADEIKAQAEERFKIEADEIKAQAEERFKAEANQWKAREEERFKAEKAQWEAREEKLKTYAQDAVKQAEAKIIGLLEQGYTLEQIKERLAQEVGS